jgi:hypothetical protein
VIQLLECPRPSLHVDTRICSRVEDKPLHETRHLVRGGEYLEALEPSEKLYLGEPVVSIVLCIVRSYSKELYLGEPEIVVDV